MNPLRIALVTETWPPEVNGVAMTSQKFIGYAKTKGYPFLCVHAGNKAVRGKNC